MAGQRGEDWKCPGTNTYRHLVRPILIMWKMEIDMKFSFSLFYPNPHIFEGGGPWEEIR